MITLLTDFGTTDSYVAEVKGVLVSAAPEALLIDVTHAVPPGDLGAAQYLLARTWHRFPGGAVHLVVVDPGVGSSRRALALRAHGHFFVGPDNGVLTTVLDEAEVVALPVPTTASPTFHGRDVFAPAAAALATGAALGMLGSPATGCVRRALPAPQVAGARAQGIVLLVDRFGSLITNVPGAAVPDGGVVRVGAHTIGPVRRTFADVLPGQPVAYVGSGGTLEIAVRDGAASAMLQIATGAAVVVERS